MVTWLAQLPRWLVIVVVAGVFVAGAIVPAWPGALLCGLIAALMATLVIVTWPAQSPAGRVARLAALGTVIALAVTKVT